MKEIQFINRNSKTWKEIETQLNEDNKAISPDRLSELYIRLTNDLSYAQTFYPNGKTPLYLNSLSLKVHTSIYENKKSDKKNILHFWKTSLPLLLHKTRRDLLYSSIIFIISITIGIVSTIYDESFPRLILGDNYVDMTIENIKNGEPMAVYNSQNQFLMFFNITTNNIKVAFICFVFGIFISVATGYVLFKNGVMLGTFQYFFFKYGLLGKSLGVVWLHGTIEIFSIIVAGAAGLHLGNSILFPKTHSRLHSMKKGAITGLKIVVGLIPFLLIAGFIESFITRYENMHYLLKAIVIISSIILLLFYFGWYPKIVANREVNKTTNK